MKHLYLGGIRSGKSQLAEESAANCCEQVTYIATAEPRDPSMATRIERHQARRPNHWATIEAPIALATALLKHSRSEHCVLIDCLGLWMSNLLESGEDTLESERARLLDALDAIGGDLILVSPEVGLGIMPINDLARRYADQLGELNQAVAQRCDRVTLAIAGLPHPLK